MNIFFTLFVSLFPLVRSTPLCKLRQPYDSYFLALTWPSTFCATGNKCKNSLIKTGEPKFTVHGLWPNRDDRKQVSYCCNENYYEKKDQLASIKDKLVQVWPSMKDDNVDNFWNYEWSKHGVCATESPQTRGVKNYFETVLKLVEKLDLDKTIKKLGFSPNDSDSVTHDYRKFEDALKKNYGYKAKIRCIKVSPTTAILEQIGFCYDKNLKMVNCQGPLQCARNMLIPTYKTDLSKFRKYSKI